MNPPLARFGNAWNATTISTASARNPSMMPGTASIVFGGILAGAGGPTAIARWAHLKRDLLLRVLDLPHGIPCKDVFRRVLLALRPGAFQACFVSWLQALRAKAAQALRPGRQRAVWEPGTRHNRQHLRRDLSGRC